MWRAMVLVILGLMWTPAVLARKPAMVAAPAPAGPLVALKAGLAPYLSHGADEPGWLLEGEPQATEAGDGGVAVTLPNLAYRHPIPGDDPPLDLVGDGLRLNGKDVSAIQPPR